MQILDVSEAENADGPENDADNAEVMRIFFFF